MLITYIKGGTPAHIDEVYICYFLTEVIKFYWLMLLLYPGELCRLLAASSWLSLLLKRFYTGVYDVVISVSFINYLYQYLYDTLQGRVKSN
jgi:hypothetical protein